MLFYEGTDGTKIDKVKIAVDRLKTFEPPEGYFVCFSGGKDSQCIYELCKLAGVKFDAHYSVTTVDPPELVRFIKNQYPDVIFDKHFGKDGKPMSMLRLISEATMPPTRNTRYCCRVLKESDGRGRIIVTGVRWAESNRRKGLHGVVDLKTQSKKIIDRSLKEIPGAKLNSKSAVIFMDDNDETKQLVEHCYAKKKTTVNPIVDWLDEDVWQFLNYIVRVPHCCLYDEGFTRIGCVGCPLQGKKYMLRDFERWPQYKNLYIMAFDNMIKDNPGKIKTATGEIADCGETLFNKWIEWGH